MAGDLRRLAACLVAVVAFAPGFGCGSDEERPREKSKQETSDEPEAREPGTVTLRHPPSNFSIEAPQGFRLKARKGVYILTKGDQSLTFSRSVTSVSASQYGAALLRQIGGEEVSRDDGDDEFSAEVDADGRRESFVVTRDGSRLAVTSDRSPPDSALSLDDLREIGESAKGGYALRAKASPATIPLRQYQAPDGGATALVPSGPGWSVDSGGGILEGSSKEGAFLLGRTFNVYTPERAPPGGSGSVPVAPFVEDPAEAVARVFPQINSSVSDIKLRRTIAEGVVPGFASSGVYQFDYKLDGKPWVGAATVATEGPEGYGGFIWSFYYSGIGVPAGSDPAVGAGLLKVWRSWNPSGAIAQRAQQTREYLNDSNDAWQEASEFRQKTADRQARDVGCLLQGYSEIEDNSRKYDLPPLDCGQQYTPAGG